MWYVYVIEKKVCLYNKGCVPDVQKDKKKTQNGYMNWKVTLVLFQLFVLSIMHTKGHIRYDYYYYR
jgi:hypothetical protein